MDATCRKEGLAKRSIRKYSSEDGECGFLSFRPTCIQHLSSIKVFVLLLSMLVTLQQALSSGYLNSVITTIEKRYEIPSSLTGVIASFYEIGNMLTVIFVSYLGSRRHAPVWIAWGVMVMGVGSLLFSVPHFITESYTSSQSDHISSQSNACRQPSASLGHSDGLSVVQPPFNPHTNLHGRRDNCIEGSVSSVVPVLVFMVAQLLLGSGSSPLLTLGTTYIDDHVPQQSSSFYIGCMYSMVAFGPVLGFLLGAYMLSHHVDAMSGLPSLDTHDRGHDQWVGMWWGGFLICGVGMFLLGSLFFLFPKSMEREKQRVREQEKMRAVKKLERRHTLSRPALEDPHVLFHGRRHGSGPADPSLVHRTIAAKGHRRTASTNVETQHRGGRVGLPSVAFKPGHRRTLSSPTDQELLRRLKAVEQSAHHRLRDSWSKNLSSASQFTLNKGDSAVTSGYAPRGSFRRTHRRTKSTGSQISRGSRPDSICNVSNYGKNVKDLPRSMWKLICNPIYMITCFGACMELMIVSGFIVFLPKYLETQFSLGKSEASMFAGGIAIPGACLGVFTGGYLLKRMQLRPKGAVQFILLFQIICLAMYSVFFFVGCDNVKMAGATAPYSKSGSQGHGLSEVNLTASCNSGCQCDLGQVEPVCGINGLTYFSACHAGCTARSNYTNCACIKAPENSSSSGVTMTPVATFGSCSRQCSNVVPFMVLLFFMTFVVAITQMPLFMVVLRSVEEEERSFALGMQFVIFRLFAYIPSPIIFGNVIDSTCVLWKSMCGANGGRCLLYDTEVFRFKYVGICAGLKILSALIFMCDWLLIRWRYSMDMGRTMTVGDIVNSIVSIDRGYRVANRLAENEGEDDDTAGYLTTKEDELHHCLAIESPLLSECMEMPSHLADLDPILPDLTADHQVHCV